MDITAKYRTRYPPKEHEEAVRMLLEGIANKQTQKNGHVEDVPKSNRQESRKKYETNYDGRSCLSSTSSSSTQDVTKAPNNSSTSLLRSKATSTSDSASIDSAGVAYKEPIPSRTIAVQCDLKSSSLKRDNLFDASMQASSISSTRYGFYNFSPETLENRRKAMRRSVSNRDFINNNGKTSEFSNSHIEAPTSMSELSSSSAISDNEVENGAQSSKFIEKSKPIKHQHRNLSSAYDSSSAESIPKVDEQLNQRKKVFDKNRNIDDKYFNHHDKYNDQENDNSIARARINSLPRRPVTALSYISTSKLRGQNQSMNRSSGLDSDSEIVERPIKNRAISQQALTTSKPYVPSAPNDELVDGSSGSNSDSELGGEEGSLKNTTTRFFTDKESINNSINKDFQGDRTEEMLIMKNGYSMQVKPAKPRLISSSHNEQVRDYKTLEQLPSTRQTVQRQTNTNNGNSNSVINHNTSNGNLFYDGDLDNNKLKESRTRQPEQQQQVGMKRLTRAKSRGDLERVRDTEDYATNTSCNGNQFRKFSNNHVSSNADQFEPMINQEKLTNFDQRYSGEDQMVNSRLNSMSLSRRYPKQSPQYAGDRYVGGNQVNQGMINGYLTSSRRPHTLSRGDRAYSQTLLTKPLLHMPKVETKTAATTVTSKPISRQPIQDPTTNDVCRSTSVRHINNNNRMCYRDRYENGCSNGFTNTKSNYLDQTYLTDENSFTGERPNLRGVPRDDSDDSESPYTRTWANPSSRATLKSDSKRLLSPGRKSSRSHSMRDVNNIDNLGPSMMNSEQSYVGPINSQFSPYNSSSESSALEISPKFLRSHQLDYDSQHRLNESGLPEVISLTNATNRPREISTSNNGSRSGLNHQILFASGRSPQIRGRAMSQQSLTRPTMPLTSGRRRGSNSGSDVGGSSMSLVSRLQGRYENAHTRSPVVMYIPQTVPKSSSLLGESSTGIVKASTLRKSSRSRQKSSSKDRSRRSLSRNGSDSESSSLFKTLVKPRSRQGNSSSKRVGRGYNSMFDDDDEENMDGVGQLASELDTYKFRRRYSVPKDAKINWFAKLKQRVSPGSK